MKEPCFKGNAGLTTCRNRSGPPPRRAPSDLRLAQHLQVEGVARTFPPEGAIQLAQRGHALAVDREHEVALREAGPVGGTSRDDPVIATAPSLPCG